MTYRRRGEGYLKTTGAHNIYKHCDDCNWVPILCLSLGIVVVVFAIAFILVKRFSKSANNETPKISMSRSVSKSKMYDALAHESVGDNDIKRV
jgi:hypothetical protein